MCSPNSAIIKLRKLLLEIKKCNFRKTRKAHFVQLIRFKKLCNLTNSQFQQRFRQIHGLSSERMLQKKITKILMPLGSNTLGNCVPLLNAFYTTAQSETPPFPYSYVNVYIFSVKSVKSTTVESQVQIKHQELKNEIMMEQRKL